MRRRAALAGMAALTGCATADRLCADGLPCYAEVRTNTRLIQPRGTAPAPFIASTPQRGAVLKQASFFSTISTTTVADFDSGALTLYVHEFRRLPDGGRGEQLPLLQQARPLGTAERARLITLSNDIWSETRFRATHQPLFITDNFINVLLFAGAEELNFEQAFANPLVLALQRADEAMRMVLFVAAQGRQ
jgi:hypothetical protein